MSTKTIHIINILLGIISIGFSLFFTWGILAFSSGELEGVYVFPISVMVVWLITYLLQIKLKTVKSFVILLFIELILFYLFLTH
ncbi:hypothetical protein GCM10008986_35120 [Salinibacillus aidingensis]|uniref:Uncharacterized protein n=1 Tax=Salinibacillus aidingensis TaxID=237684 RepID=A0ABP3LP84_9BACI